MENHIFPLIGCKPIDSLKTRDLLPLLISMNAQGIGATTGRVKTTMSSVFRYAVQRGIVEYNPAHDLKGALTSPKTKHRPALPLDRLPELMTKTATYTGRALTKLAVLLSLHTFVRSSELRHARWDEINFDTAMWTIPGQREEIAGVKFSERGAKMGSGHAVPLSSQAIDVLKSIKNISNEYTLIFPGDSNPYKPMSENTVNKALRTMGYDTQADVCLHGFRAMACSALTESGLWVHGCGQSRGFSHVAVEAFVEPPPHEGKHVGKIFRASWGRRHTARKAGVDVVVPAAQGAGYKAPFTVQHAVARSKRGGRRDFCDGLY